MSILAYVRDASAGTLDYEGQVFGHSFDLMEAVSVEVGLPNPMNYAVDENTLIDDDELDELIEAAENKDEDGDEAEELILTNRGEYFNKSEVLSSLQAYQRYFSAHPQLNEGKAKGEHLALDLADMIACVEVAPSDKVRIYLG